MKSVIKLLVLEDIEEDYKLIERTLKNAGLTFQIKLVDTKEEYIQALQEYRADIVLSDHSLPQFNSSEAFNILKSKGEKIPFIIVTGNVSEEFAVKSIKQGVDDYILKSNLDRLPSAICNALQHKQNEDLYAKSLRELEENNRMLVRYNKELETFVTNIPDNLRNPLTSMLDVLHLIKSGQDGDGSLNAYFDMMETSIHKLDEALKDLQKHPSKNKLTVERIDIEELLSDYFERMMFMPGAGSISKEIKIDEKQPFYSDGYLLSVIVNNLISNAIKYHDPKKQNAFIKISVLVDSVKASLEFQDNGIGIDEKLVTKIFDMYFRATGKNEGAGLGLHIVKEAVDKLKGDITVISHLGYGTIFRITLPNYLPAGHKVSSNNKSTKDSLAI